MKKLTNNTSDFQKAVFQVMQPRLPPHFVTAAGSRPPHLAYPSVGSSRGTENMGKQETKPEEAHLQAAQ